jgi:beta-lactamase class A
MSISRRALVALSAATLSAACSRRSAPPAAATFADADALARGARALSAGERPGLVNLGVMDVAGGRSWCADPTGQYPTAGVARLLGAAAALARVDGGRLRLDQRISITAADLAPPPSRINRLFPDPPDGHRLDMPLADLVALAIQEDDSTAADVVLGLAGGPAAVTAWLRGKGVEGVRLDRYERERTPQIFGLGAFQPEWKSERAFQAALEALPPAQRQDAMESWLADARDTATMGAVLTTLRLLALGRLIGPDSTAFLLRLMASRRGGARGLAAGLPAGAQAASVGAPTPTVLGYTAADDEAGLATLAGGRRLAMAVFIAGSTSTAAARARLTAQAGALLARAAP